MKKSRKVLIALALFVFIITVGLIPLIPSIVDRYLSYMDRIEFELFNIDGSSVGIDSTYNRIIAEFGEPIRRGYARIRGAEGISLHYDGITFYLF